MNENYTVFLVSDSDRNYQDSVKHVIEDANYVYECNLDKRLGINELLRTIDSCIGNPIGAMNIMSDYYLAKASSDLLLYSDVKQFKQDAYVGAKLEILGAKDVLGWISRTNTRSLFAPIMSDSPDLIEYLIKHKDSFKGHYKRTELSSFFLRNTLLALAGDWEILKERTLIFLNEEKLPKSEQKRIPDHEFYLALCNQDKIGMEAALNKLLEPKMAKKATYACNVWFDFYLQMQVVLYGKIASIHGFGLDIDSPIAPKELIKYDPLPHYEDPYDFMKEFDYNRPQQEWIDMWQERMRIATEKAKKKKGFFSWFRR